MLRLYTCLAEQHDLTQVGLAALICILGSHAAFVLLRLAEAERTRHRLRWVLVTALVTGTAVWATHFIAMLAYKMGDHVGYDLSLTLLSLVIPVAATALAIGGTRRIAAAPRGLVLGTIIGLGTAAMHYTGMAAYDMSGSLVWDMELVPVSVGVGVALHAAAFRVGLGRDGTGRRLLAGGLLAGGICALHFIGMTAITVFPGRGETMPADLVSEDTLAVIVGIGAFAILSMSLLGAAQTYRERQRGREEAQRMRALVDATVEGLLVCDGGTVVTSNRSSQELLGREAAWFAGRPLNELIEAPATLAGLLGAERGSAELELTAASGERIPAEIVARPITYDGRPHRLLALRDLRDRRQAEERIRFLAHHDALTHLPNRVGFAERLAHGLETRGRSGEPFAVLALDLDRFKVVNDTLGHAMGDALLVKVAARLRGLVRASDIVARLGGDEFAVVQFASGQPQAATVLAERLVELLSRPFLIGGQVLNIGTSVGVALFPTDGMDQVNLIRNADLALYRAKAEGRGTHRFFEAEMDTRMQRRRMLEVELRTALAMRQFHLLYQPQLSVGTDQIGGFEALIRWTHPKRGLIAPAEFIPLAEETGLIVPIGEWVLREACREAATWPVPASIAVNLSPLQFRAPGLVQMVRSACASAGLDPRRLELEITESVLLTDSESVLGTLRELKALGIRVSMDDFGTGYSSLSYLRAFPFDKIKIDRSFVVQVTEGGEDAAIVRAIIGLGRSLGMQTTVEGVETLDQLNHVRAEGCDQVQGYLVGHPLPAAAALSLLARQQVAA